MAPNDPGTLTDQSIADAVQCLKVELIGGLGRDELHGRALDSLSDGFRISEVILLSLRIRAYVFRLGGRRGQAFAVCGYASIKNQTTGRVRCCFPLPACNAAHAPHPDCWYAGKSRFGSHSPKAACEA
jgi:hypothetical protein